MSVGGSARFSIIAVILKIVYNVSCFKTRDYAADIGKNITIPCNGLSELTNVDNIMWVFQGKGNKEISQHTVNNDSSLSLSFVESNDTGLYSCIVDLENSNNSVTVMRANLTIKTQPPQLVNVSVHLSTILGIILWDVAGDGGYPIIDFTAEYRSAIPPERKKGEEKKTNEGEDELEPWRPISPNHISPNARQIDVYHLIPNASYFFRVWANNVLGPSIPVEVLGHTLITVPEKELIRHFLTGAENFDTRVWIVAVAVVMGTLCILTVGTCLLLYRECRVPNDSDEEQDVMELVPNIILNPGFMDGHLRNEDLSNTAAVIIRSNSKYSKANGSAEPRKV